MKKRILIVEDHADIRRLIRMTMEFEECEIFEASDFNTGLSKAREVVPDLVLLDVMMPGTLSGLDLCRAIKNDPKLGKVPVLILSARSTPSDHEAGLAAGADDYLVKPFSPMQLLKRVSLLGKTQ